MLIKLNQKNDALKCDVDMTEDEFESALNERKALAEKRMKDHDAMLKALNK